MVTTSLSLKKVHCILGCLILLLGRGVLHGLRYLRSGTESTFWQQKHGVLTTDFREFPYFVNLYVECWIAISNTLISSF